MVSCLGIKPAVFNTESGVKLHQVNPEERIPSIQSSTSFLITCPPFVFFHIDNVYTSSETEDWLFSFTSCDR